MVNDPLMYIKKMEQKKKDEAQLNPMELQKIKELVDQLREAKKDKKKKHKKDKKDKKHKKRKRSSSSESYHRKRNHRSRSRSRSPAKDLGPDMSLYGSKKHEIQNSKELRKNISEKSQVKKMSHEEKLFAVKKMQDEANNYHQDKIDRLGVQKSEKLTAEVIQNE